MSLTSRQSNDETAKIVGISRWELLEALGFSDEWAFVFADDQNFWQVPAYMTGVSENKNEEVLAEENINILNALLKANASPML